MRIDFTLLLLLYAYASVVITCSIFFRGSLNNQQSTSAFHHFSDPFLKFSSRAAPDGSRAAPEAQISLRDNPGQEALIGNLKLIKQVYLT